MLQPGPVEPELQGRENVYRVYCFDGGNRIIKADWIEAASDTEALEAAKTVMSCPRTEVWQLNRLVGYHQPGCDDHSSKDPCC